MLNHFIALGVRQGVARTEVRAPDNMPASERNA
jgi:hypothetical protein